MNCKTNVHIQMAKLTLRNVAVDAFIAGGILAIMEIKIIKRNGEAVPFDRNKIFNAICKAMDEVGELDTNIAHQIAAELSTYAKLNAQHNVDNTVEDIQDEVENLLMQYNLSEVARAYIRYRYQHEVARGYTGDFLKAITEKLTAKNVQNQNANVDEHSFGGRKGEADSVLMKKYALDFCMSKMAKENHLNNEIYIHDLDTYPVGMHNCLSVPFDDLLARGFNTRQTDVRPANSINTAFQLVAVLFQLQSLQQFGGVSATHLDWTMVPYVRRSFYKHYTDGMKYLEGREPDYEFGPDSPIDWSDYRIASEPAYNYAMDMTKRELKQAVEGMYHNLNTLQSRSGNQLPFTSINYGTCTLMEGRMVIKALLEGSLNGVGKHHKTPIFPCGIFQCMKGVNREPEDPNYDLFRLALQSTAKRLYPNYANVDWSGNAGYDKNDPRTYFSTMGCRTANGWDINGFGQLKDGRGNICPVTVILPTLAMEAKEIADKIYSYNDPSEEVNKRVRENDYVSEFMILLDTKIHEAKDMLIERFEYICKQNPASAKFMYENQTMAGYNPDEGIRSALKHGTLALGQLGLAEALQILIGEDQTSNQGMQLAHRIESLFRDRCKSFKEQYKLNFGVYYTPAENLCYTAMSKFKAKYGEIPNVSDREYFTNSTHVPVWKQMSPFDKIDIESQLTGYSSAGCITYVEMDGGMEKNIDGLETLVNYAMDHDIPYFAINVPNDTCMDCGYVGEFNDTCPECGSHNIQQLRRVTGYLTGDYKTAFNYGKQKETENRFRHTQVKI